MEDITVDPNGVQKLLCKFNIHKAFGPDGPVMVWVQGH